MAYTCSVLIMLSNLAISTLHIEDIGIILSLSHISIPFFTNSLEFVFAFIALLPRFAWCTHFPKDSAVSSPTFSGCTPNSFDTVPFPASPLEKSLNQLNITTPTAMYAMHSFTSTSLALLWRFY